MHDLRIAAEAVEAFDHYREYLASLPLPPTALQEARQAAHLRSLMKEVVRRRYAFAADAVVGTCGHRECGQPLYRYGQLYCSTRCRVAVHRAGARFDARARELQLGEVVRQARR